jgi:oxygen-dependent protoporphyrinogen oxidase
MEKKVAIIGAGITGLTAAYYLKKAGISFSIFEKTNHIGGVIDTKQKNDFTYETGPNSGILSTLEIADLFNDLKGKCEIEIADHSSSKRLIWKKDQWHALPSGLRSAIETPLFSFYDKLRILGEPFRKKGNNPNESLAEMVKRRLGKSFLDYAIDPFILGIYAGDPNYLIPKYALPKLYNLEQDYGSFIKGAIKKKKLPKTEDDKKVTREIFSVKGGLINLVNALCDEIESKNILLNINNLKFLKQDSYYILNKEQRTNNKYTHILSTINAGHLSETFSFLNNEDVSSIDNLLYAKVSELTLGFKNWKGIPLDAFGGLVPFRENRNILGILFLSNLFAGRAPKGGALLTIFTGGTRKPKLANMEAKELKNIIANELKDMMKLDKFNPDLYEINTYEKAIAQYGEDSKARLNAISKIENQYKGLYMAGSMRDGVGLADRVKQANQIVKQIKTVAR